VKKSVVSAALVLVVGVVFAAYVAAQFGDSNTAKASLDGWQENPSISTTGTGTLGLRIRNDTQEIEFVLSYDNLEGVGTTPFVTDGVVTAAHIHVGRVGVNGGVSAFLCGGGGKPPCPTPSGTVAGVIVATDVVGPAAQGINPGEPTAFAELVKAVRLGFTYVNVHTTRWGGGEIRGQIRRTD
jgi:CHRD domain